MKAPKSTKKSIVLGSLTLLILLVGVFFLGLWLLDVIQKLDPTKATIFAALISILGIVITQALAGSWNRKLEKERAQLNRRTEVYETLVTAIIGLATSKGNEEVQSKHLKTMLEFGPQVIVWGSPGVLHAWNNYRHRLMNQQIVQEDFLKLTADLMKAIRKDLGHKDSNAVHDSDLLMPFINDAKPGLDYPPLSQI